MEYYEDLSEKEIESFKAQNENPLNCPKCNMPLIIIMRDSYYKYECTGILDGCYYTKTEAMNK